MNLVRFCVVMAALRVFGAKILWIAHNLYPHDGGPALLAHRFARRVVVALASWVGVHGAAAAGCVSREFGVRRKSLVLLEHGHWVGFHANRITRSQARARLALEDDAYVFLFIGLCKPYKNLVHLVHSHGQLRDDSLLWIAGRFQSSAYFAEVEEEAAQAAGRVFIRDEFVASEDLQLYLNACDAVVLPYREILTSGSAMLALSFGRPVIAPRMGALEDLITSDCGLLYDPRADSSLVQAMRAVQTRRFDPERIILRARQFSWARSARAIVRAISGISCSPAADDRAPDPERTPR